MECNYCKKKLSSKSALNQHQKKTKYCLKLQGKDVIKGNYPCNYCKKTFLNKHHLTNHQDSCKSNTPLIQKFRQQILSYRQQIMLLQQRITTFEDDKESYEKKIVVLEERYEDLAKTIALRPTTTNNNTTTNNTVNLAVFDKSPEDIKRIVEEKFSKDYLIEGQKGCAQFVCDNIVENDVDGNKRYLITDKSRGNAKYKLQDGNIVTDNGMNGLTNKLHPDIKNKSKSIMDNSEDALTNEKLFEGFQEVLLLDEDNGVFVKNMVKRLV